MARIKLGPTGLLSYVIEMPTVPVPPSLRDGEQVVSIGVDVIHVSDVRRSLAEFGDRYLYRMFTPGEIDDCGASSDPVPRLAARYAAKEATIKALRVEGAQPAWTSMEVSRHPLGWCEEMRLTGRAGVLAGLRGIRRVLVSLSHEHDVAIAMVVATGVPAVPEMPAVPEVPGVVTA